MAAALHGISLGLSTGLFCLAYCAPVFVPVMMAERRGARATAWTVGELAAGRLIAYALFGLGAGYLGVRLEGPALGKLVGAAMVVLSVCMLAYALTRGLPQLPACRWLAGCRLRLPIALGFLTGLNPCPPFLLAISSAVGLRSVAGAVALFAGFFLGTSVYLAVLFPLGWLGRWPNLRLVAVMVAVMTGVYFLAVGVVRLVA